MSGARLRTDGLAMHFGGVRAVDDVSIDVAPGSICGLVGPNGSGKTTMLGCLSRMLPPTSGRILLDDVDITRVPRHRLRSLGLARTFQNIRLLGGLSVRENVMVGLDAGSGLLEVGALLRRRRVEGAKVERVERLLEEIGLGGAADREVDGLPYGLQRRVEIARALATEPRLLLLDEPVAGMNDAEVDDVRDLLVHLRDRGTTIVLVEHHLDLVMQVTDQLVVLDFGRCIAAGEPATVAALPEVREAYFGKERDVTAPR